MKQHEKLMGALIGVQVYLNMLTPELLDLEAGRISKIFKDTRHMADTDYDLLITLLKSSGYSLVYSRREIEITL